MIIRFYREGSRWYADLPEYIQAGGTKEDCEMVCGADEWLEIISQGESEVTLRIDSEPFEAAEFLKLESVDTDALFEGAYYRVQSYKGIDYSHRNMWLCPVTLFVFGKYPDKIYYK